MDQASTTESYQAQRRPPQTLLRGFATKLAAPIRSATLGQLGYPVSGLPSWCRALAPLISRIFQERALYRSDLRRFPLFCDGGSALEIGCGAGEHLNLVEIARLKACGRPSSAPMLRPRSGMSLSEGPQRVDKVIDDVVHHDEVEVFRLERRSRQVADMDVDAKPAVELLREGGQLLIETPNVESIGSASLRKLLAALGCSAPSHLFFPRTLSQALLRTAFLHIRSGLGEIHVTWLGLTATRSPEQARVPGSTSRHSTLLMQLHLSINQMTMRISQVMEPDSGDLPCAWGTCV